MKILIGYPPLKGKGGSALLSQNRQFQWFTNPTYIFPVIPASAATLLKTKGYDIQWRDCIAENVNEEEFFRFLEKEEFNLFIFETKTPVIKQHWKLINKIKDKFNIKIVLIGDHVTALPEESFRNSKVDYILCGGDYDFMALELVENLTKKKKLPKGVYYKENDKIKNTGKFELKHNLDDLPFIDRELCKWRLYQREFNIPVRPYMYLMSGRDCWWGKCSFCAWPQLYPKFRVRSVKNVLDEIGLLIERYNVREIFDDSGTLTTGKWMNDLCNGLIERGYNKKIRYSCNMRFGALNLEEYRLMKKAGFRLLKFGLESANKKTLDRLEKGIKLNDIVEGCKLAKKAGLTVHLTMILGFPFETKEETLNTYKLTKSLMLNGYADVLQSTIIVPYPGTKLYYEGIKNNWFRFEHTEYERYDMREQVLKTDYDAVKICNKIYKIFINPIYVLRHLTKIRNLNDVKYTFRGVTAVLGHLKDFS